MSELFSPQILEWAPKLLLFLSATPDLSDGIFTNFSQEPTWRWYFAMTPFEAFFLGIILTQFAVLNLLGIFPLNLSGVFNGMASGRRKREAAQISLRKRDIASQLLKLMKKLDPDECSFKAICELEAHSVSVTNQTDIPQSILSILDGLKLITKRRQNGKIMLQESSGNESLKDIAIQGIDKTDDDVISLYENAVRIGDILPLSHSEEEGLNSSCEKSYPRCPINGEEVLEYARTMQSIDDLFPII